MKQQKMRFTDKQLKILSILSKAKVIPECIKKRAKILIKYKKYKNKTITAKKLKTTIERVTRWEQRWIENQDRLTKIEKETPRKLKTLRGSRARKNYESSF